VKISEEAFCFGNWVCEVNPFDLDTHGQWILAFTNKNGKRI
jgi:hypothetical protein